MADPPPTKPPTAMSPAARAAAAPDAIGRGRSAVVFREVDADGEAVVRKVFLGDTASRLVHEVLSGAPNPYAWCADAVHCAWLRRRLLEALVPFWFGPALRLPATRDWGWDAGHRRYFLRAGFVRGRHLPLRGPLTAPADDRLPTLLEDVIAPLTRHLEDAGLVGLVWQAGRGNPVAVGNFLLESREDGTEAWVWIDLESGVPALFSPSPHAWWTFYLPWTARLRRPLFDDVDVGRLRRYLDRRAAAMEAAGVAAPELAPLVDRLETAQRRWKGLRRTERALLSEVAAGRLDAERAKAYHRRPLRTILWLAGRTSRAVGRGALRATAAVLGLFGRIRPWALARAVGRFVVSQRHRAALARRYVERRILSWHARGFFDDHERDRLLRDLEEDESSEYVTDFGVHLLVKPFVKFLQWVVLPLLFLLGVAKEAAVILLIVTGGAIVRTLYTSTRFVQALFRRQRLPWTALGVGALPWIGNAAWPAELIVTSVGETRVLARFLLQDVFASFGRKIPIWGGPDTLTEHVLCRLPDRLWRRRRRLPE